MALRPTLILHLSDLHLGEGERQDVDWKTYIDGANRETRRDRLLQTLLAIPRKPDFVVLSGDITIAGRDRGFDVCKKMLREAIDKGVLPGFDRFISVPGNHDVQRANSKPHGPKDRWTNFCKFSEFFVRPWIPDCDAGYDTMLMTADGSCQNTSSIWGGIGPCGALAPATKPVVNLPFLLDFEHNILFYAFNSAHVSGTRVAIPDTLRDTIDKLRSGSTPNQSAILDLISAFENELEIDPAMVDAREFQLFSSVINLLTDRLQDKYSQLIKVAVLHHHVAPMLLEEVKKFELLLNAGRFKYELKHAGFHVVLHGHKHDPAFFLDTTVPKGGSLVVVSGGTIGGGEASGSFPGFHLIEFDAPSCVKAQYVPLRFAGNPRESFFVNRPVNQFLPLGDNLFTDQTHPQFDLERMFAQASSSLVSHLREQSRGDVAAVGWSHHLPENEVSPIATAFGLRIMSLCRVADPSVRMRIASIVKSLWTSRHKDGCWSASSQRTCGSPEATSWVLLSLWEWPMSDMLPQAVTAFERLLDPQRDPVLQTSTFSVALVVDVLSMLSPESLVLLDLTNQLAAAAGTGVDGSKCWSRRLNAEGDSPSILHTARSVIALLNCHSRTNGRCGAPSTVLESACDFLLNKPWTDTTEDISRLAGRRIDKLVVKHFTATWAIRALLALGVSPTHPRILSEIVRLLDSRRVDGLWDWSGVSRPIWATHDALDSLRIWQNQSCNRAASGAPIVFRNSGLFNPSPA